MVRRQVRKGEKQVFTGVCKEEEGMSNIWNTIKMDEIYEKQKEKMYEMYGKLSRYIEYMEN